MSALEKQQNHIMGFSVLKIIMCFMVVTCHYWDPTELEGIWIFLAWLREYVVCVFMFLSFYLMHKHIREHRKDTLFKRLVRLLIPQIGWALIYWGVYFLMDTFLGTHTQNGVQDLFLQILTGHTVNESMWFLPVLIILTIIFWGCSALCKQYFSIVLFLMLILAYIMQYSGVNMIFMNMDYSVRYTLGRFCEMIPFAVIGYLAAQVDLFHWLKEKRVISQIVLTTIIVFIVCFSVFSPLEGYGYSGIEKAVITLLICAIFYCIPTESMQQKLQKVILVLARYTFGIYCIHRLVGTILGKMIEKCGFPIEKDSYIECVIIFVLCYGICFLGGEITRKSICRYLFE